MKPLAFQDQIPDNHCWGCGNLNPHSLQIKSYWSGEDSVCTWHPKNYHAAGPQDVLNGGVIATIIDCHCICTAVAAAYREENRAFDTQPPIWYVTGSLNLSYLRPTPIQGPVTLRANIQEKKPKKIVLACSLYANEEECVQARVVAVRVPAKWGLQTP